MSVSVQPIGGELDDDNSRIPKELRDAIDAETQARVSRLGSVDATDLLEMAQCLHRYLHWYFRLTDPGKRYFNTGSGKERVPVHVERTAQALEKLDVAARLPLSTAALWSVPWEWLDVVFDVHALSLAQAFHPQFADSGRYKLGLDTIPEIAKLNANETFVRRRQIFHDLPHAGSSM